MSKRLKKLYKPDNRLDKYDHEEYTNNPLLTFSMSDIRERRHHVLLKKKAADEKIRLCRTRILDLEDVIPINESYYKNELHKYANETPIPRMLKTTENKILSYVPKNLKDLYPQIVKDYMSEVHVDFNSIIKTFSLQKMLVQKEEDKIVVEPFEFKRPGKTPNYKTFLKNRRKLSKTLVMVQPYVRCILHYSAIDFPEILNNFDIYRKLPPETNMNKTKDKFMQITLEQFEIQSVKDVTEKAAFIKKVWYPKIVAIIKKYYRKRTIPKHMWSKILHCANGLVVREIRGLKLRTILNLNQTLLNREKIPFLKLKLTFEDYVDLYQSLDQIFSVYFNLMDEISYVCDPLSSLEESIDISLPDPNRGTLKTSIPEVYLNELRSILKHNFNIAYKPLIDYLDDFQKQFKGLYSQETQMDMEDFLSEERTFEEYLTQIDIFKSYIDQLRSVVEHLYFDMAKVTQTSAVVNLKKLANEYIDRVTVNIVKTHKNESIQIAGIFEGIRDRALEIPRSTEQLLAGGEWMLYVKTKQMFELRDRIQESFRIGGLLVELTDLSEDHIKIQIAIINWLNHNIQIVFDQNASLFEQYKSLFEEKLGEVTRKLNDDLNEIVPELATIDDMCDYERFNEYFFLLKQFNGKIKIFEDYVTWINKEEVLFKFPKSQYSTLVTIKGFVEPFTELMRICIQWLRYYYVWMDGPFEYLDPKMVEETVDFYYKDFLKTQKFYRNKIKEDMIGSPICKFRGQTEDPDPEKHPVPLKLCAMMVAWIKDFRIGVSMVNIMCNPALRPRHWEEMSEIAGFDLTPDAGTTLRKILAFKLDENIDKYEIVSIGANKELQLQENLKTMKSDWDSVNFSLTQYKDTNISILSSLDDIQAVLDDHIIKTLSMRGSAFVRPAEQEVKEWFETITRINSTLDEWSKVQSNWLYLLPIFSSKDIVSQMPEEGRLFQQVDNTYRRYMMLVHNDPSVINIAPTAGLLEAMILANEQLEEITNGVNNYLEKKRLYFPRFFFLSNDEMLEILSETKNPLRVQPFLNKCFEGISRLEFDNEYAIHAMYSSDKEAISFQTSISTAAARGSVEKWLLQVEEQMLLAVENEISSSFADYLVKARKQWVLKWPQMVILCVSQVFWARDVGSSLSDSHVQKTTTAQVFSKLKSDLNDIVALIRSKEISNLNRITIKSLIVIDVHAKDVVESLIQDKINSAMDFKWLAQLRYYFVDGLIQVKIINAMVMFANEYLGNSDRLVITPLTDRCYRTLIGAYQLHLNGAPEGPAGTGKTETTKDLAKALAVQCKVFNCSDGLDYKAMGKFFKGLASCGAWACFDEFNRIELEVLSVVAQQILCIIHAVRGGVSKFIFEGTELSLNPACYVCITMNPGYAGRSELPDNLKVLFRTVAMMVPDYAMIGEISLYSFGFVDARKLSVKIVTTYRLCSEQLSSQNHYDYGMRAVKTVLSACGNIKKAFPDELEDILLLRSLLDVNLPKFLTFDVPLFEGIISDLFPGVVLPTPDYNLLTAAFNEVCGKHNLQPKESFLIKVIQTYEMIFVRHGFMLVGEPFSGKSCTLKVLAECLSIMKTENESPYHQNVQFGIVNPKSITMGQLYGAFDPVSYEWTDGIAATIFRMFATEATPDRKWLIFDGPVDAVWIENMNTVLDDNKKLCLTSGEVVLMSNEMSIIFEVMDLAQASPATVSRCGMIYLEAISLGWESHVLSWLNQVNPLWIEHHELILEVFEWLIPTSLKFVKRNCQQLLKPGEINTVRTTLRLFEIILNDACAANPEDFAKYIHPWILVTIYYCIVWGIGGILDGDSRDKFDVFLRELIKGNDPDYPIPVSISTIDISLPTEGILFDYFFIYKQKGVWRHWPEVVRRMEVEEGPLGIQVPTIDTARYAQMIELHVKNKLPMLLVGPTGTGKSFYVQNVLMSKLPEEFIPAFIAFTVTITANQTQDLILTKLVKRKRGIYGAPKNKTYIIFVDDMSMPAKEIYGAQPPIELLRQFFDYQHWFDLKDTSKLFLKDILFLTACGLVGGSRQDVYQRFLAHWNIFSINAFAEETMFKIFSTILLTGLKKVGHASDVIIVVNAIVSATLKMYALATENLRPTPAKCHYIFNMRDVSRVVMGCSLLRKESVDNKRIYPKLWSHEIMRIFYDRLVDADDRNWFFNTLKDMISEFFRDKMENIFEEYCTPGMPCTLDSLRRLMFGRYLDIDSEPMDRKYEEIPNMEVFRTIAYAALDEYNSIKKSKLYIVLFEYALEHLSRICRTISMPAGSALNVGMGGSGRQSLIKLAAQINQQTLFQPEITKNYSINDWRDDLKKVLKESGGRAKDTIFLLTENQIKMEEFLQDIDCLLNLGEVPNIFPIDEKQEILEMVRLAAQGGNRNIDISPIQVFSFFINRCKQKLHIILCFSPIGSSFRTRIRFYPSLVNCCTIDWFDSWPESSLEMVAYKYLDEIDVSEELKQHIVNACKMFHTEARETSASFLKNTGRITYITSASFLELMKSYRSLITRQQTDTLEMKQRYVGGLDTLDQATQAVGVMQRDLNELQPQLVIMAEKSRIMADEIETKTREASVATEQVKRDEIQANIQADAAQVLKGECEKDLAQAIPVLEEAIGALNTLKPSDITLVKSMKNPPEIIKLVMASVCVIKGIAPDRINDPATGKKVMDYWAPSKKILGDMQFLQNLKDFDKDNINPEIMKRIRKEFIPNKNFKPEIVAKASSAAEGLCKWIIAMDMYDAVAKVVAPKKARLEMAEKEYNDTMKILKEKMEMARLLSEKVAKLTADLIKATEDREKVEYEVEQCKNRLMRAEALIGGLGGERSRWTAAAESLQILYDNLPGDILVSCGVIAYLAPLTSPFRNKCIENWHKICQQFKIPCSDVYSFVDTLGTGIKVQNWNLSGLPRDIFSAENGVIMDNSNRYSLFIDPQGQALKWIKTMERSNRLQILKFSQPGYMKKLETCLEFGNPVLFEAVKEELDAPLDPLLLRNTFKQGGVEYISMGDNVITFSSKFRLYFTSSLRNPHYLPEVFNKVTIINFALTPDGLEDQLLGIVVAKERPDLEELRQTLIIGSAKNRTQLKEVEDNILKTLSASGGDILGNEQAIIILDQSKVISVDIKTKQERAKETELKIESFRQSYKPVASHSAVLYYCITDLSVIDPMYQFSLNWYINLYIFSIENANKSKDLVRRLKFLTDAITFNLYCNVCRSLFEKDKLLFSFILTTKILLGSNQIVQHMFLFLLTGGVPMTTKPENPDPSWITIRIWESLNRLEQLPEFKGFLKHFMSEQKFWEKYYDSNEPHLIKFLSPWEDKISKFEKLLVLRVFRPDKIIAGISDFVTDVMGATYISPPPFDISKSYEDSNCLMPLVFILSPGADPMGSLVLFAEKMGYDEAFKSISLGQGQGPIAQKIIEEAQELGSWVCLQNCHLALSWMPSLELIFEHLDIYNTSPNFRLWLTSYPTEKFPTVILQNGVKMTNEPPTGLQSNLLRSYNSEPMNDEAFYMGCPDKDRAFTKLLYGICFFHAVVQERKKFGPMGWNISYGFNESDFQISVHQLQMFLNQYEEIPYAAITYLTGECNYGGRVTDAWDRRAIITILNDYVNSRVISDPMYRFSEGGDAYCVPIKTEHREVIKFIEENIPNHPAPEVYGLHSNAGITRDLYASDLLLDSMLLTLEQVSSESTESTDILLLETMSDIFQKLPKPFDIEIANEKFPVLYNESMNTVLVQEMQRFNNLLNKITSTCIEIMKAVKGIVVMTPEFEAICSAIMFKKIPNEWLGKSYPSLKPVASYINDFVRRLEWLTKWYDNGKPPTFWLAGFFFTQAFLTGAMQNYARKYGIPIDTLTFDFSVTKVENKDRPPDDGVYVNGMFLEGARWDWDKGKLEEQMPKVLIEPVPMIHLIPILVSKLVEANRYKCPLYKTAERKGVLSTTGHSTNFILPFLLQTQKPASTWVKRSVAMICQTND